MIQAVSHGRAARRPATSPSIAAFEAQLRQLPSSWRALAEMKLRQKWPRCGNGLAEAIFWTICRRGICSSRHFAGREKPPTKAPSAMRARLALLLLFAEVVITRSQTTADVDFMKSSPLGCFSRGYEFDFYIPNTNINTTQLKLCQEHCQYVPGCLSAGLARWEAALQLGVLAKALGWRPIGLHRGGSVRQHQKWLAWKVPGFGGASDAIRGLR
eukprot:g33331.t1